MRPIMLTALVLLLASHLGAAIAVRADKWMPFNGDPKATTPGYAVELVRRAWPDTDYQLMPWARTIRGLADGTVDVAIGAGEEDVTSDTVVFPTEPIGFIGDSFFVLAANPWRFDGIASLGGIQLGCIKDYGYDEALQAWIAGPGAAKVQTLTGDDAVAANVRKLIAGRLDAVVEAPAVFMWSCRSQGIAPEQVVEAGRIGEPTAVYAAISRRRPDAQALADRFDQTIRQMRANGELAQLLGRYGQSDWVQPGK